MLSIPRKYREMKRFNKVAGVLLKKELAFLVQSASWNKNKHVSTEPEVIRSILDELGGPFIKLGQLLSLRPDLIPFRYCDEMSKLQDSTKPFPSKDARAIFEEETGKKVKDVFKNFSGKPVASASIGQVHKAVLKTGETVAVKIQRPGIKKLMETDIDIMSFLARQIKKYANPKIFNPEEIVEEFKDYTEAEMDYIHELNSLRKFYDSFNGTTIAIPKPYPELSTSKVLVMEYLEGEKLNSYLKKKISIGKRKEIAEELVNSFYKQVFLDGFFHADPHPGNILVMGSEKKIALLDFGITGRISDETMENMKKLFIALIQKDIEQIIDALALLHLADKRDEETRRDLRDMLSPYYSASLKQINIPRLFLQAIKTARKHDLKVPRDYVLLGKAIITLESVCRNLYPDFNFAESSKPFLKRLIAQEHSPAMLARKASVSLESFYSLVNEFPDKVNQYFDSRRQEEEYLRTISKDISRVEKDLYVFTRGFALLGIAITLLVSGFMLKEYHPLIEGVSIYSIISFALSLSILFLAIKMYYSKSKNY